MGLPQGFWPAPLPATVSSPIASESAPEGEISALRAENARLRGQVDMWEKVFDLSHHELIEARELITAQERVLDLSQDELRMLRTDIERLVNVDTPLETEILGLLSAENYNDAERIERLEHLHSQSGARFCVDALRVLMNLDFPPEQAEMHWNNASAHWRTMQARLDRPTSFAVALLDYFTHNGRQIHSPKIMEISVFAEMIRHAVIDPLTGLYNRRFLDRVAERELRRAGHSSHPLCLIVCDIDHFKKVNDQFGHSVGDEVLLGVATVLREAARLADAACRLGGEEFLLLTPGLSREGAFNLAERLRSEVASRSFPIPRPVTMSVGIAAFPEWGPGFAELFLAADQALYKAKESGRNCTIVARAS